MDRKLNVCLINDSFPPTIDGVSNAVYNYASIIEQEFGHAIVATPEYPHVTDDYPFEVMRFPSIDTTKLVGYWAGNPLSTEFVSELAMRPIDIIHCHCPVASMYLARILRGTINKPVVITYHTKFDIEVRKAIDNKTLQAAAIKTLVNNISSADEVWAVSKGAGENLKGMGYQGDYLVMPNGVDFDKGPAPQADITAIRKEYRLPDDRPIYLFVGRMMWYKGLRIILDALAQLKAEHRRFHMLFVGGGGEYDEVYEYCVKLGLNDCCGFTGAVHDRAKLKAIYSCADLFLFPSTFDTNGIAVREAAASGTASVLIRDSCAAEDVTDGRNAFLIEENAASMHALLYRLGEDTALMHEIGDHAMNDLYTSWHDSVARAVRRYQVVIDQYQQGPLLPKEYDAGLVARLLNWYSGLARGKAEVKNVTGRINEHFDTDRWL